MSRHTKSIGTQTNVRRAHVARLLLGLGVAAFALHGGACSPDVQDQRTATSTGGLSESTSSGVAGMGGNGGGAGMGGNGASGGNGGMGTGGGSVDGGSGDVEYLGYNLFTHVPRFMVVKVDHTRNLCFRIWMAGFTGPGMISIDVTMPWAVDRAEVTNDVNDCTMSMGFPPTPVTYANATSGMGTMVVTGGFPCSVDLHAKISFDPVGPWVPTDEPFDVDGLNVDGGCG